MPGPVTVDPVAEQLERARGEAARLREQRSQLLAERAELSSRLDGIVGTVGYRVLSRWWSLARRAFPFGSRRRALYRAARALASRLQAKPRSGGAEPALEQDLYTLLLPFSDRVYAGASGRLVLVLSGTPLVESEGQRPARLALALARRGIPVVFAYWRWGGGWRTQDRLHEGILQVPLDVVARRPELLLRGFPGLRRLLLVELPWPGLFTTLAEANAAGWVTVYDVLDDWAEFHRVGQAEWFDEAFERHVITASDAVFAVNDALAARVRDLGGAGVGLLPNGLQAGIERVVEPRPLARGEVTIGYFGYLAGAWFDWRLVAESARRRPTWRFYLIGYGGSPDGIALPGNVTLLGRKEHHELAAYAANWDVAVVPFKAERLAAGADPIKTYEYLAMGLPVVTTGVPAPAGGESLVRRADSVEGFLAAIGEAAAGRGTDAAARTAFALGCTWERRIEALLAAVDEGDQRVGEKRELCGP